MRKLAYVVDIRSLEPIPNSNNLEVAIPNGHGWEIVVQKGEFQIGDLAVMFEIDAFLDPNDERYSFLKERCLRKFVSKGGNVLREGIKIKTIKLRGQISQGLLMPLDKFPEILARVRDFKPEYVRKGCISDAELVGKVFLVETAEEYNARKDKEDSDYCTENQGIPPPPRMPYTTDAEEGNEVWRHYCCPLVGADVTALLHVEHYDEVKEQLQPAMGNPICADAKGKFPSDFIPKSDEERIQGHMEFFEAYRDATFEITAKDDGSSMTVAYSPRIDQEDPFIVCSRNLRLKRPEEGGKVSAFWQVVRKYDLEANLKDLYETLCKEFAFQGELVGPGVNADRDGYKDYEFHVFRIWDIINQGFVPPKNRRNICHVLKLPHVQVIEDNYPFFQKITTIEEALKFAEGKTIRGNEREGIVLKQDDGNGDLHFKIVSNRYLLKQED